MFAAIVALPGDLLALGQGLADDFAELHELDVLVQREAGAGGDEVAHDDVLLEAAEIIHAAEGRGFGQDASGVLEARGGDEAVGFQRGLGDAEQDGDGLGGLAALGFDEFVLISKARRSIWSPHRSEVSPGSVTFTLRSIWRTMISMCLSAISTPWRR